MLHWLVIGIGDITTKRVIPAILAEPRSELYGIVTRDPEKARPYEKVRVWTDLETALEDPVIQAVYVATPVALHAPQTLQALRAGRHVLCEKPMALRYEDACAMHRVAHEAQRLLGVAYYRRMFPKLIRARQLLLEGVIGRLVLAESNHHGWSSGVGGAEAWRLDPARAGNGPLHDVASHRIDALNFLFGKPVRVCGQMSNLVCGYPVEDCVTAVIEYECGVRGIVDARWHSRIPRDEFRIIGTEGEMNLSPLNGPSLIWTGGREELPAHANAHYPCIENFVHAVLNHEEPASSGASALLTDWVIEQIVHPAAG